MGILNEALAWRSGTIRRAFILLSVIVLSFPIPILPMELGLDFSWMAGINFAMYSGLVFGRDIMFTYGPLGFVLVPSTSDRGVIGVSSFFVEKRTDTNNLSGVSRVLPHPERDQRPGHPA